MSFWKKVDDELKYQGISRDSLAQMANFTVSSISAGISRDNMPSADLAVRIAKVLHKPLEYFLDDSDIGVDLDLSVFPEQIRKNRQYVKYCSVYDDLERLPVYVRQTIIEMIHKLAVEK
ncbi:helix-turn-helix domain-containing protein [Treponema brennaborense]|uniref:Helix-turn-helix domain protein n=1 Tax=Treponema brennaborense (strain DSM 12168 / CIP 105900 / DD5/3) TaxID=906968 RepID=F4LNB5_TREBD|nr:helix-turn-helix transcriptional regulator [Treponema brennaborense]AEE17873.1 helix-turn-helix domain protein [Treponema brennaborense DSM 12168]